MSHINAHFLSLLKLDIGTAELLTWDNLKYQDLAQENVWMHLWGNIKGFVLEKDLT